jgi:hypothetical protein
MTTSIALGIGYLGIIFPTCILGFVIGKFGSKYWMQAVILATAAVAITLLHSVYIVRLVNG